MSNAEITVPARAASQYDDLLKQKKKNKRFGKGYFDLNNFSAYLSNVITTMVSTAFHLKKKSNYRRGRILHM